MCRITGIWQQRHTTHNTEQLTIAMRDTLAHGGPDAVGIYVEAGLGFGHRRLAIIDLSDAGIQPMHWERYVIVFNGEIYNYQEIKADLIALGHNFTTSTDTEVILKSFHQWGFDAPKRYRGMFAFALWDKEKKHLMLCRDRVGVKPMFWYQKEGLCMFASELKAFHEHPDFDKTIDKKSVSLFLQQGYIHSPHCIYQNVRKVEPGTWLVIKGDGSNNTIRYWAAEDMYVPNNALLNRSEESLAEELESILLDSFQLRMVADVPVGMFLSGGIDSSLVTALLQKNSNRQLKTFTIGFEDPNFNEAGHAKAVSQHIGTDHTEIICTVKDFEEILPKLPDFYDEPFGDSSAIPTFLVSRLARKSVTVSLSADGGDEIFGGYTKYEITKKLFQKINSLPTFAKKGAAFLMEGINPNILEDYGKKLPFLKNYTGISNKFHKLRNAFAAHTLTDFYNTSSSYFNEKELLQLFPLYESRFSTQLKHREADTISYLSLMDIQTYLEGDIMTKVDRATMQVALEGREPFLDQQVMAFGLGLPDHLKIKGNETKYLLRKVLYKHVPETLINRPKQGFTIPVETWLRSHLKEELIIMLKNDGFFDTFGLSKINTTKFINDFVHQQKYINPIAVWFIYVLYKWHLRWK
jgi:asparagine synthase (glutamine-hydrolysing)